MTEKEFEELEEKMTEFQDKLKLLLAEVRYLQMLIRGKEDVWTAELESK